MNWSLPNPPICAVKNATSVLAKWWGVFWHILEEAESFSLSTKSYHLKPLTEAVAFGYSYVFIMYIFVYVFYLHLAKQIRI